MALDLGTATTALVALAAVLGLIVICARAMRRFGLTPGPSGGAGRRLAVLEVLPLDGKRRLVLLRCDAREVLVLTGGPKDVVLQTSGSTP
jgi:flagellar protein FliO/FliZ